MVLEIVDFLMWYALFEFAYRTYYDFFVDVVNVLFFEKILYVWMYMMVMWVGLMLIFNFSYVLVVIDG